MRICIPISADTEGIALRKMARSLPVGDQVEILFELRLDRMRDANLERILREKKRRIVVTNRRREEGGGFQGTEKERIAMIRKAVAGGADFVDVEASTNGCLLESVKAAIAEQGHKTLLIVSFHDFEKTPSEKALRQKMEECAALDPDIIKIITFSNTQEDNLKSLGLLPYARRNGQEIISFCMGEKGRLSRVMSLCLGAYMGFASLDGRETSAPGQLTVREMIEILGIIGRGNGRLGEIAEV
jgi:3-dehydroquinate dehydratase type I